MMIHQFEYNIKTPQSSMTRGLVHHQGRRVPDGRLEKGELVGADLQAEHLFSSLESSQSNQVLVTPILIRTHRDSPPPATC